MRYHDIPIGMAKTKKWLKNSNNTKCWRGYGKTGSLTHAGGNVKWHSTLENSLSPNWIKHTTTIWLSNCTLRHLSQRNEDLCSTQKYVCEGL